MAMRPGQAKGPSLFGSSVFNNPTLSGTVNVPSLTASQAVFTDAGKNLVSNPITGSGNGVMSNSPTLTGTILGANQTLSGVLSASGGLHRSSNLAIDGIATDKGYGIFGASAGTQVQIDNDEVQAMNGNSPSTLFLNARGGAIAIGSTGFSSSKAYFQSGIQFAAFSNATNNSVIDSSIYYLSTNVNTLGATIITLPAAASNVGTTYFFEKVGASLNTLTIIGNGAELVGTANTVVLGGNVMSRLSIICNGTGWSIIELYEEGTYPAIITGCTTSPTITVSYVRNGKQVSTAMATLAATSNTTACTLTGMPSHLWPATAKGNINIGSLRDNSTDYQGIVSIGTTGVWTLQFYSAISTLTGTFTVGNLKGPYANSLSYTLF